MQDDKPHLLHVGRLPPALLAPHVASGTCDTRRAMADRVVDKLRSFFATGQMVSAAPAP